MGSRWGRNQEISGVWGYCRPISIVKHMSKISAEVKPINVGRINIPAHMFDADKGDRPVFGKYIAHLDGMFEAGGSLNLSLRIRRPGPRGWLEEKLYGVGELEHINLRQSDLGQVEREEPGRFEGAADEFYRKIKAPERRQKSAGVSVGQVTIPPGVFDLDQIEECFIGTPCRASIRRSWCPIGGQPHLELVLRKKVGRNRPEQSLALLADKVLLNQIDKEQIVMNRTDRMKLEAAVEQLAVSEKSEAER